MMQIIGITGGVGAGKSQVLSYLSNKPCTVVCQADKIAFELEQPGHKCYDDIVKLFGTNILNEDGTLCRESLARIVFQEKEKLLELNHLVHPTVKQEILKRIKTAQNEEKRWFFIEAALFMEEKYDAFCTEVWYIYTDLEIRKQRLKASRNYTDEKIQLILDNQKSEKEFEKNCQIKIENSSSFADTKLQIDKRLGEIDETLQHRQ